ncbi:nucleotidyl transferase AbiEii/AbiGii toxin family protein [Longispora urticae]
MDPLHERIARVALRAAAPFGFCLAGGYAIQAHGMVHRRSEDVDLFTEAAAEARFPEAVDTVVQALTADGLTVRVEIRSESFARLHAADQVAEAKLELAIDWRAHPPTIMDIGPVLHPADAVANKLGALYGRAAVRDYVDIGGVLASGRFTGPELLRLAIEHDPGFDPVLFAEALAAVDRLPASAFAHYDLSAEQVGELRDRLVAWSTELRG